MHHTKKDEQQCFSMELHIGVDSQSGLAHSTIAASATVHDKYPAAGFAARTETAGKIPQICAELSI